MNDFYLSHLSLIQFSLVGMVLAASVQVVMRAGVFSLASVGFWGIGAYTSGLLVRDHGVGAIPAVLCAILLSAVVGYALALAFVRLRGLYLAMATVSFDLVVVVLALKFEGLTGGPLGMYGIPPVLTMPTLLTFVVLVALVLAYTERGHVGRTIDVTAADQDMAGSLGIKVAQVQRRAFVLSCVLGGLAGGMSALLFYTVTPTQFGFNMVTLVLSMSVVGGLRSWTGAYFGAVIVYWLPEVLRPVADWRNAAYGALLILVLIFEPQGILGLVDRLGRLVRRPRRRLSPAGTAQRSEVPA